MCGFAGGTVTALRGLAQALGPGIEVWGLEYPGRGLQWRSPCQTRLAPLLENLLACVDALGGPPLVLLGYSMGAHLAYRIALSRPASVAALILLSARPPGHSGLDWLQHGMDDEALTQRLGSLGGIPPEVLANRVLMEGILPVMRADLSVCADLARQEPAATRLRLMCPLLALQGTQDRLLACTSMQEWLQVPQCQPELSRAMCYPGGHFFHRGIEARVATDIRDWLGCGPLSQLSLHHLATEPKGAHP
jgi:surfactin synthase thioesterase subunit